MSHYIASRPRVVFVNRFYFPDHSATSQILTDITSYLASQKIPVTVICTRLNYDNDVKFSRNESINDVVVHRLWTTAFGRKNPIGRAMDYLTFYLCVCVKLLFFLSKGDVVVAKTDPPMLSVPVGFIARVKRAICVNWLQDIFPEVAVNIAGNKPNSAIIRAFLHLRNRSLRKAHRNVVIGNAMENKVVGMGVAPNKISVIHNFVDDSAITPKDSHAHQLRKLWGLKPDDFVVGYSGNLGRAHDLDTVLTAATRLQDRRNIKFLFIGGGFLRQRLQTEIKARKLANVLLKPYVPRESLPESLSLPNLHWASLVPSLEGYIVPSKIYGIAAAGRPLLMIGATDGEVSRMITRFNFGINIRCGDTDATCEAILKLASDDEQRRILGENARVFIDQNASRALAQVKWQALIRGALGDRL